MPSKPTIEELFRQGTPIDDALRAAAREAVRLHQHLGNPIAVWREGHAVDVAAHEVEVPGGVDVARPEPNAA
jgi:hypothetical protein